MGGGFSSCRHAVVTSRTSPDDSRMTESGRNERNGGMTNYTFLHCWNMSRGFADRIDTVVTRCAIIDDTRVTKYSTSESGGSRCGGGMTHHAVLFCRNVVTGQSGGNDTIMATGTVVRYSSMIEDACGESSGFVANTTIRRCRYVIRG